MSLHRSEILIRNTRMALGEDRGHGVAVELSDGQIILAIRSAFSLYNRYFPKKSIQSFTAPMGVTEYKPDPRIRGIINLVIQPEYETIIDGGALVPGVFSPFGIGPSFLGYGTSVNPHAPRSYATFLEWQRGVKETFSSMPGYYFNEADQRLLIYSPTSRSLITVTGTLDYDIAWDEEDMWTDEGDDGLPSEIKVTRLDKALAEIPTGHMRWIRIGTLAKSKQILGRMLRKYSEVPTIDDQTVGQDGSELVQEGQEEWTNLQEEVRRAEPEPPPIYG